MFLTWDVAVNGVSKPNEGDAPPSPRPSAVTALVAVLLLETAALAAAVVYFVVELLVATPSSVASAVGITVIVAAGAVWVGFIAVGVLRGQAWTRAATVVVQVLIGAVAIGSFQGADPRPDLGIVLLVPAILALVLLFTKPVLAATEGRDREPRTF
jgi:hypothetical protein